MSEVLFFNLIFLKFGTRMFLKLLVNFWFAFVSKLRFTIFSVNFWIFSIFLSFAWKKRWKLGSYDPTFPDYTHTKIICLECSLPYCAVKFLVLLSDLPGNFCFSIHRMLPWKIHHVTLYWNVDYSQLSKRAKRGLKHNEVFYLRHAIWRWNIYELLIAT